MLCDKVVITFSNDCSKYFVICREYTSQLLGALPATLFVILSSKWSTEYAESNLGIHYPLGNSGCNTHAINLCLARLLMTMLFCPGNKHEALCELHIGLPTPISCFFLSFLFFFLNQFFQTLCVCVCVCAEYPTFVPGRNADVNPGCDLDEVCSPGL